MHISDKDGVPMGFARWLGVRLVDWRGHEPHFALDIRPEFLNRNGFVHGGVILSLLDTVCSLAGCRYVDGQIVGRVVAVSLTTNFIAPIHSGTMHGRATLRGGGRTMFMVDGSVHDDDGALLATATGVGRHIREHKP